MGCNCVVGLQWGDEAKGKIVDLLTHQHDFVVRYNGGPNAGHTVVHGDNVFKLSLLPTGILQPNITSVIGNGLVINPIRLLDEMEQVRKGGIDIGKNLLISDHAHVIFPYHLEEERLAEENGTGSIGTTLRGVGPCYGDKIGRVRAVRLGELLYPEHLKARLEDIVVYKNRLMTALAPSNNVMKFDAAELASEFHGYGEKLRPFVTDTTHVLHQALAQGKRMLFEAAQGSLLDVDHGTYPYVTSSNSSVAGVWSGSGVPARYIDKITGVVKAYTTRVGRGPFPTELDDGPDGLGEKIRQEGKEFGTVTGRPRRCGWFDAVAVRYTAALSGVDELALMLLDVLSVLDEIKICTEYVLDGEKSTRFPSGSFELERCEPVYETLPGWRKDITGVRKLEDLPTNARRYLDRISELIEKPIKVVSVGPDREQTMFCD